LEAGDVGAQRGTFGEVRGDGFFQAGEFGGQPPGRTLEALAQGGHRGRGFQAACFGLEMNFEIGLSAQQLAQEGLGGRQRLPDLEGL
jgi:hypothetical protein